MAELGTMQIVQGTMGALALAEIGVDWLLEVIHDSEFLDFLTMSVFEVADYLFFSETDDAALTVLAAIIEAKKRLEAAGKTPREFAAAMVTLEDTGEPAMELAFDKDEGTFIVAGPVGDTGPTTETIVFSESEGETITGGGGTVATNGNGNGKDKPKVMTQVEDLKASSKESFFGYYKAENGSGFNRVINDGLRTGGTVWPFSFMASLTGNVVQGFMNFRQYREIQAYEEHCGKLDKEKKAALTRNRKLRKELKDQETKLLPNGF